MPQSLDLELQDPNVLFSFLVLGLAPGQDPLLDCDLLERGLEVRHDLAELVIDRSSLTERHFQEPLGPGQLLLHLLQLLLDPDVALLGLCLLDPHLGALGLAPLHLAAQLLLLLLEPGLLLAFLDQGRLLDFDLFLELVELVVEHLELALQISGLVLTLGQLLAQRVSVIPDSLMAIDCLRLDILGYSIFLSLMANSAYCPCHTNLVPNFIFKAFCPEVLLSQLHKELPASNDPNVIRIKVNRLTSKNKIVEVII